MKSVTISAVSLGIAACFLAGCGTGGVYIKTGKKYAIPGGDKYLSEDYVREVVAASGVLVDEKERTASNPDIAGINSCMDNAKLQAEKAIMNKVIEGVMTASEKVGGKQKTLNEATLEVQTILPHLGSYEIYHVIGDECYANSGTKIAKEIKNQAACSCEYYGAVEMKTITDKLQNKYGPDITALVKSGLVSHNAAVK